GRRHPVTEFPEASGPVMRARIVVARLRRIAHVGLLAVLFGALATPARADEVLVLKDGRKIPVTRLARKDGQVVFQTTRGETFSVPEDQVVSPPLASIPAYPGQVLVLKDGGKIPAPRPARGGGLVLFETARGERFSVAEDQVISPPLDSIPAVEGPPAPMPPAPETKPETPPAPEAPTPETPAPSPTKPAPPEAPALPELVPPPH